MGASAPIKKNDPGARALPKYTARPSLTHSTLRINIPTHFFRYKKPKNPHGKAGINQKQPEGVGRCTLEGTNSLLHRTETLKGAVIAQYNVVKNPLIMDRGIKILDRAGCQSTPSYSPFSTTKNLIARPETF